ncbi:hypothetical protein PV332_14705 [Streptomyces scabiei]|uniref:hypothetical protein n=1 Tax=Streptomyces scabiei TaxID=1930 RepID=UPI0029BE720E|nr:hypothetical protein [Streptomyces scabiei]MDX2576721.1 hypothetical protein [Streptomyces scabiei]MDX3029678.1 hypothetical protein [Streptomyces scabiei]MDX3204906.1 hypothetical protein [Streptomyces scabiei]
MLDRFAIDDGRHLLEIVIDEDASAAAGEAQYRADCSCGRMPHPPAGTRDQALATHIAHVNTRIGPSKGPDWLPLGARLVLLFLGCMALWAGSFVGALELADAMHLTGSGAAGARVGGVLTGFAAAGCLMVAVRRYIAPTRA